MSDLVIRAESTDDARAVFDVEREAFGQPAQAMLVDALRERADPQLSLVAERDASVVGHVFFSPVAFDDPQGPSACQLSPLAVVPEVQGRGIGSALMHAGLDACSALGWKAVFLLGDPRYYVRFGFRRADTWNLVHSGRGGAYLQALELEAGALSGVNGEVRFHPAFDAVE